MCHAFVSLLAKICYCHFIFQLTFDQFFCVFSWTNIDQFNCLLNTIYIYYIHSGAVTTQGPEAPGARSYRVVAHHFRTVKHKIHPSQGFLFRNRPGSMIKIVEYIINYYHFLGYPYQYSKICKPKLLTRTAKNPIHLCHISRQNGLIG